MSLLAELKRRNVFRMAGLYLVGAWLVVQIAETLLPIFHTPDWVLQALVVLLAIGFLPALVFSWVFELTPDGLKRDSDVDPTRSVAPQTAQRMDRLILVGLVAAIAVVAADRYWPRENAAGPPTATTAPPTEQTDQTTTAAMATAADPAKPAVAATSGTQLVAVLPFRNRSARAEDAYFAEGVHDDLLTQLSKLGALKVISRTSMMHYADTTKTIPQIAAELGAAVVLEGAIQRAGDNVRVNVQLIDGVSDVHLWAENYDRKLTTETIFAIQADIAHAVASALQVVLSPEESSALRAGSTQNLQAYEAFLRGKLLSGASALSAERSRQAIAEFDRAIALDPDFAEAYARKAQVQLVTFWLAIGPRSLREDAHESVIAAQRLAPDSIDTLLAQAIEFYYAKLDYAAAEGTLQQILARVPEHAEAWEYRAYVARRDGRFDDSTTAFERSLAIDPQALDVINSLIENSLLARGDVQAAKAWLQRARDLGDVSRIREIWIHRWSGDTDGAWATIDGPLANFVTAPAEVAMESRDPERIAYALSPALWPEDQRSPGDFPETYALTKAESLLVMGQQAEADQLLAEIQARMAERSDPYPSRWLGNAYYQPCDLPGLMGDLEGVRAAEADYLRNAPRDVWGSRGVKRSLAVAFARAGDPARALDYLEEIAAVFGPHAWIWFSVAPGLDSIREQPRYLALEARYRQWAAGKGQ
ncbi:MAG: tetratricopeptide repeat protein [Rhodanobacteraceae bacterium]|nr:tetratricopeptide repeat protein [Rhodanobacteraceae bacterium]